MDGWMDKWHYNEDECALCSYHAKCHLMTFNKWFLPYSSNTEYIMTIYTHLPVHLQFFLTFFDKNIFAPITYNHFSLLTKIIEYNIFLIESLKTITVYGNKYLSQYEAMNTMKQDCFF